MSTHASPWSSSFLPFGLPFGSPSGSPSGSPAGAQARRCGAGRLSRGLLLLGLLGATGAGLAAAPARAEGIAAAVAGAPYSVTVAKVAAKLGQPATARIIIKPAAGWHLNKDFPTTLKLRPPTEVTAQKTELGKSDVTLSEQEGRFDVVLTSAAAGTKAVPGELRFAVCTETSCNPQKSAVTIQMDVK